MKIRVNPFDKKSIDAAIKQLKQYEIEFAEKEAEFARRLAEVGVRVASAGFATADYDGVNDVVVSLVKTNNGATVVASGETVGFIEFGTGITNPEWDASGMEYTPPQHGTYGKGKGKNPNGWYFVQSPGARATHTYGNVPAEAMRTARDVMVEQAIQIAREVWR
jgi:hypothetical protein